MKRLSQEALHSDFESPFHWDQEMRDVWLLFNPAWRELQRELARPSLYYPSPINPKARPE